MARIAIDDLPILEELTQEEMEETQGGLVLGDPTGGQPDTLPVDVQR
jgi:hypothetical protein